MMTPAAGLLRSSLWTPVTQVPKDRALFHSVRRKKRWESVVWYKNCGTVLLYRNVASSSFAYVCPSTGIGLYGSSRY